MMIAVAVSNILTEIRPCFDSLVAIQSNEREANS
jgi:hypothetical protein